MHESQIRNLVGEIVVAGFTGLEVNDHARHLLATHQVRNVILFSRNVAAKAQLQRLTADLQALAQRSGADLPLIICTDQENGIVRRVAPDMPGLPGNMAVAATGRSEWARDIGKATAAQLRSVGVNMNLAPVLDVNNNPHNPVIGVRSYGEDPQMVAEFGVKMIRGLQESGVIACGKHFPGHGDTQVDSHLGLPVISHPESRLEAVELAPFRAAIQAGIDVLMTAHVVFPAVDPTGVPATLSRAVLTGLLREKLQFSGVITTDCLEMNAIADTVGVAEGAVLAVLAGADMVMISHRLDRQEAAIEALVAAVQTGRVPMDRLQEAATRVRRLRSVRLHKPREAFSETPVQVGSLQQKVCRQAVTFVHNDRGILPVSPATIHNIQILLDSGMPHMVAAGSGGMGHWLSEAIQSSFPEAKIEVFVWREDGIGWDRDGQGVADLVVAGLHGTQNTNYLQQLRSLATSSVPLVVMVLQSPYDLQSLPEAHTAVAVYENTPWMVQAGVAALIHGDAPGRLPVTV